MIYFPEYVTLTGFLLPVCASCNINPFHLSCEKLVLPFGLLSRAESPLPSDVQVQDAGADKVLLSSRADFPLPSHVHSHKRRIGSQTVVPVGGALRSDLANLLGISVGPDFS